LGSEVTSRGQESGHHLPIIVMGRSVDGCSPVLAHGVGICTLLGQEPHDLGISANPGPTKGRIAGFIGQVYPGGIFGQQFLDSVEAPGFGRENQILGLKDWAGVDERAEEKGGGNENQGGQPRHEHSCLLSRMVLISVDIPVVPYD
jgi:hypothetical protein